MDAIFTDHSAHFENQFSEGFFQKNGINIKTKSS